MHIAARLKPLLVTVMKTRMELCRQYACPAINNRTSVMVLLCTKLEFSNPVETRHT